MNNSACVLVWRGCSRSDPDGDGTLFKEIPCHDHLPVDRAVLDGVVREDALGPVDVVGLHPCADTGESMYVCMYVCMNSMYICVHV